MSIVINAAGSEVCYELAETHMYDDLKEFVSRFGFATKQAFFTAYEAVFKKEFGRDWEMSIPNPIY